ncbi:MAG: metallophosphoesterase [Candidatus Riflebacteria bacterium]|nr:metallophosphoesterase [Candidatus Riflebacteria bacterium]
MKIGKKILYFCFLSVFVLSPLFADPINFTVICTNDLHSNFEGNGPDRYFTEIPNDGDPITGHYARIAELVKHVKSEKNEKNEPVILLDSGDYSFGTLFHIISPSKASEMVPEFQFFCDLKYDAITMGNHDFESEETGLAISLKKAAKRGLKLPFVVSNLFFRDVENSRIKEFYCSNSPDPHQSFLNRSLIKEYYCNGKKLRIGVIGILGPDAAKLSLANRHECGFYGFDDESGKDDLPQLYGKVNEIVKDLKENGKADVIIALMHGGELENRELIKNVPDINLIVAGHTHQAYFFQDGDTTVIQTGTGGKQVGLIEFAFDEGKLVPLNPQNTLVAINDSLESDKEVIQQIESYKDEIKKVIPDSKYSYDSVIYEVFSPILRGRWPNNFAGVFVASSILKQINKAAEKKFDLYITTSAMVRSDFAVPEKFPKVVYQFSDIFKFLPLGYDDEMHPGAEIISYYLTKHDFKKLLEAMFAFCGKTPSYEPVLSDSVSFSLNSFGIPLFNKIGNLKLNGKDFKDWPELIHVCSNSFFVKNLMKIKTITRGWVEIPPRNEKGEPITSFEKSGFPKEFMVFVESLSEVGRDSGR